MRVYISANHNDCKEKIHTIQQKIQSMDHAIMTPETVCVESIEHANALLIVTVKDKFDVKSEQLTYKQLEEIQIAFDYDIDIYICYRTAGGELNFYDTEIYSYRGVFNRIKGIGGTSHVIGTIDPDYKPVPYIDIDKECPVQVPVYPPGYKSEKEDTIEIEESLPLLM